MSWEEQIRQRLKVARAEATDTATPIFPAIKSYVNRNIVDINLQYLSGGASGVETFLTTIQVVERGSPTTFKTITQRSGEDITITGHDIAKPLLVVHGSGYLQVLTDTSGTRVGVTVRYWDDEIF